MKPTTRAAALLLIAIVLGFGAVPAVQAQESADLELVKVLFQTGEQVFAGDQVSWNLTLTNYGPDAATGIEVTDDLSVLTGVTLDSYEAGEGTTFDGTIWSIPSLAVNAYTTLNLTTTIAGAGDITNTASITKADQTDPDTTNNEGTDTAGVGASVTAEIDVKPETLNLGSRGVFTVFIRFDGDYSLDDVNLEGSSLVCNGAAAERLHVNQKDGGTLMAKFRRQELTVPEPDADDATGDDATDLEEDDGESSDGEQTLDITCEGTVQFGDETVEVSGTDTVRVTGEKKKGLDALLAKFLDRVLPVDDDAEEAEETGTATPTPDPEQARNRGQLKKGEVNGEPECTDDCNAVDTPGQGKGKKTEPEDDDSLTGSQGKGNQGNGRQAGTEDDDGLTEKGNQGNDNKPEKEKGNGNGKK